MVYKHTKHSDIMFKRVCTINNSKINIKNYCTTVKKKVCVVGAGPAGFYASQYILKHLDNVYIDIIEKLPVPYGLVRYGVAPDHPEVKNVINTFKKVADNPNFRFIGNVTVGNDIKVSTLRKSYHAVVLAYGAEQDKKLDLEHENVSNVISARNFVAWYNGLPGFEKFNPDLQGEKICIIGQGNVAIDVARILLSPISSLQNTDITNFALEKLYLSKVKEVQLIGRRGPLQAAFTIKELREILKLPNITTIWREEDFNGIAQATSQLPRPRKRITELMLQSLSSQKNQKIDGNKKFCPIFFRSPVQFCFDKENNRNTSLMLSKNYIDGEKSVTSTETEVISADMFCKSIGYQGVPIDSNVSFNKKSGYVENSFGRVLKMQANKMSVDKEFDATSQECGLYTTGWIATGPTGVLITTMNNSFAVAETICKDFKNGNIKTLGNLPDLDMKNLRTVDWNQWERIDKFEIEKGKLNNKPREKIVNINEMLNAAGV